MVQSCPVHLEADPNLDMSNEDQAWSIPRGEPAWGGRSHGSSGNQTSGKATAQHASYTDASEQETSSESGEQQEDQGETLTMAREEARMCEHFTGLALSYKSAYPEESTQELNQAMVSKHAHLANWHANAEKHIMTYYDLKMQNALTMKVQMKDLQAKVDFQNFCRDRVDVQRMAGRSSNKDRICKRAATTQPIARRLGNEYPARRGR